VGEDREVMASFYRGGTTGGGWTRGNREWWCDINPSVGYRRGSDEMGVVSKTGGEVTP
jgi:hypothetical protein